MITLQGTGKEEINVTTNPATATVTATSETIGVATATYTDGKVTITGVEEGSAIVRLEVSANGYATWTRTIHVVVE